MDGYDYGLPVSAIAQVPIEPRSAARLLVDLDGKAGLAGLEHRRISDLPELLQAGDVLVLNETRVIPARLRLEKSTGGKVEVLLLEPLSAGGVSGGTLTAFPGGDRPDSGGDRPDSGAPGSGPQDSGAPGSGPQAWKALIRPGARVQPGTELFSADGSLAAVAGGKVDGQGMVRVVTLADAEVIEQAGVVPLPPYIRAPLGDPERYQTVYARVPGSVAAPTAGLHLTREILEALSERNVKIVRLNLCVGLATFKPMTASKPEDHVMHSERYEIGRETMDACENARRVVAVGTTVVRALETAAATGELSGQSELFIHGRYPFQLVDVLLTNFHLPRSSLLLLVEAFVGPRWRDLYRVALERGYRFLSFGDAMLLERRSW